MYSQPPPNRLNIAGFEFKKYPKPPDMCWAQHLNFDAAAQSEQADVMKIAKVIAICIQSPDSYDEEIEDELMIDILELPMKTAFSIAGFFFRQSAHGTVPSSYLMRLNILLNRCGLASVSSTASVL
jgi:hypothetical protein